RIRADPWVARFHQPREAVAPRSLLRPELVPDSGRQDSATDFDSRLERTNTQRRHRRAPLRPVVTGSRRIGIVVVAAGLVLVSLQQATLFGKTNNSQKSRSFAYRDVVFERAQSFSQRSFVPDLQLVTSLGDARDSDTALVVRDSEIGGLQSNHNRTHFG